MALYLQNLLHLFIDMSFYIVIGLIFTGLLHAFIKKDAILKQIGKNTVSSVVKASIYGVPLPLCSCGVVPTAIYLGKSGASKGAVVSFLTSTPQTGVDSLIATYGMMGPLFAVYRAVTAFISGIITGLITNVFCREEVTAFKKPMTLRVSIPTQATCSCGGACHHEHKEEKKTFSQKLVSAFHYAFGEFLDEIAFHYVIGLLIAAAISTLLPTDLLTYFSNPLLSMILMVIIGIPMYICSTASIPIAVSLMLKGISPGAAFVFLFAGPVTNIASLTIIMKTLGKKTTAIYLASVSACAIAFGLVLDGIISLSGYSGITKILESSHEHELPFYIIAVAVIFGLLLLSSFIRHFTKKSTCSCGHEH